MVADLLIGKKTHTLGGALFPDAVLKKGTRLAFVGDLHAGDSVMVPWKRLEKGLLLVGLIESRK